MEKQRNKSNSKSGLRLLKIIFSLVAFTVFINSSAFSQALSINDAKKLRIVPSEGQNLYTKSDIKFEVLIPNLSPSDISIQSTNSDSYVTLKTMRKTQEYGENPGTRLELWYNFDKKGEYKLRDLNIQVRTDTRKIAFEPFTISSNPEFLSPRIVILFPNETAVYSDELLWSQNDEKNSKAVFDWELGKKMKFTVCLQYAVQLVQFNWELPVDSIFTQTQLYEITEIKYREKRYSEELIPVAEFEWTSLTEGKKAFPQIKMTATGYNGYRNDLYLPEFFVNFVKEAENSIQQSSNERLFSSAFDVSSANKNSGTNAIAGSIINIQNSEIGELNCIKLAELRKNERSQLLKIFENRKMRKAFEEEIGISGAENEFFTGWFYLALIIFVIFTSLFIIFLKRHSSFLSILNSGFMIFSLVFFIYMSIQAKKSYGISKGVVIRSIPEVNSKSTDFIGEGNRVQIIEKAGSWIYIKMGESGGWCMQSDVIKINR